LFSKSYSAIHLAPSTAQNLTACHSVLVAVGAVTNGVNTLAALGATLSHRPTIHFNIALVPIDKGMVGATSQANSHALEAKEFTSCQARVLSWSAHCIHCADLL